MPSEVRYHKSAENIDDAECATVKPLSVTYRRFTVLERALMVALSVFIVLAIVFGILYATSDTSETERNKHGGSVVKDDEKSNCTKEDSNPEPSPQMKSIMDSLDWSVDPCDNFYNFSCNKWLSEHDIPPSQLSFSQLNLLAQDNYNFFRQKLQDKDTLRKYENIEAVSKALNDYSACVSYADVKESEKYEKSRKLISDYGGCNISNSSWSSQHWKLLPNLVKFHRLKVSPLFHVSVRTDIMNSTRSQIVMTHRATVYLMPTMYLSDDPFSTKRRNAYQELMLDTMTELANTTKTDPVVTRQIREIFEFEKLLAEISPPLKAPYNTITIKELQNATGNTFNWLDYFQGLFRDTGVEITKETSVNVGYLDYIKNITQILETTDDVLLANYMIWELVIDMHHIFPDVISKKFVEYRKSLYGTKSKKTRTATCFQFTRNVFGLPLSLLYIDEKFGKDKLKHIEEMVTGIWKVSINNMETISWMDPETKRMALKKARSIKQHVGYPKIVMDHKKLNERYAEIEIKRSDYFGNWIRKKMFHRKKNLQELQKPVDKSGWPMDPVNPNAYYDPTANKITIPVGILQSPFFDTSRPMSSNYGGIGMIIGHELTHSFDNKGREFDENGNYFNWWKNSSLMEFNRRTECLAKKYSKYSYYGFKLKGEKSLDENIADSGGIKQAFQAYLTWRKQHNEAVLPEFNLTNNQLFFIGSAQIWCSKHRYSVRQMQALAQRRHPPEMIRVIGTLSNYPEFSKAFNCPVGSRMNPKEKCNIW